MSNCYDELDHSRVLEGVQWALHSLPEWITENQGDRRPVRTVKGFSVHKYDRKDCHIGNSYDLKGERVNVSSKDVLEVCKFDVQNSVVFVLGKLWRRVRGAPMGGFLSAFYAMLCFGYIEHKCVSPMFARLGLPGGVRRYLDDVLILVAVHTLGDREKASNCGVDGFGTLPSSSEAEHGSLWRPGVPRNRDKWWKGGPSSVAEQASGRPAREQRPTEGEVLKTGPESS